MNHYYYCLTPDEQPVPDQLQVKVQNDEHVLVNAMGALQVGRPTTNMEPGEKLLAPFAMPLHGAGTDRYGHHSTNISIDNGLAQRQVDFWVLHPDERQLPQL